MVYSNAGTGWVEEVCEQGQPELHCRTLSKNQTATATTESKQVDAARDGEINGKEVLKAGPVLELLE